MTTTSSGLLGREDEQARLAALVGGARNGRSGTLVILGEPGMGKTSLLGEVATRAEHARVLRIDGYESEATIPYAGLHRLTLSLREFMAELPPHHRDALDVAVGRTAGAPPDRFLVGLGVLELLGAAATDRPTLCVVDDAHLVDAESLDVLAFVARRLMVERLTLLCAGRDEGDLVTRMRGIDLVTLSGLATDSAVNLFTRAARGTIDPVVATQVAHATGGNPLALIELARSLSPAQLTDLGLSATPVPVGQRLERHYIGRVDELDAHARTWLLLAAADSTRKTGLVMAAADTWGLDPGAPDRAEAAGLVEIGDVVRFRHPLIGSAVYGSVDGATRRRAHRSLARAAAALQITELEAWHASRATVGIDDAVAAQLERVADMAARRGGMASRARMLGRAAELTSPGPLRDARQVSAAEAALAVGAGNAAATALDAVDVAEAEPVTQGRVTMARATLAAFTGSGPDYVRASADLVRAADLFHGRDAVLEQRALVSAAELCMNADRLMEGITTTELGHRLHRGTAVADGPAAVVLAGLGALIRLPYAEAVPHARTALDTIRALPDAELMHSGISVAALSTFLWDTSGRELLLRAMRAARDAGALQVVDLLLKVMSLNELSCGTVRLATRYAELLREVRLAMGYGTAPVLNPVVLAWTGSPRGEVLALAAAAQAAGRGGVSALTEAAVAVRDLAGGSYHDAYDRLRFLVTSPFLQVTPTQWADHVEAAARSGHPDEASSYAAALRERAVVNGSPWCRGVADRATGLAASGPEAEKYFRSALDALEPTAVLTDRARTHLVYGEWLRRSRRRADAVVQLREAIRLFEEAGAQIFVPRATAELEAAGSRAETTPASPRQPLTTQELTIAEKAAAGRTNAEIASNMFISANTVDYHLRKVFQKLGISSRRQLADRLGATHS
ncbi:LuxR family transcriptional regulator [Promicromonospora sp. NPDC050262]|uniref:helix-turn-helix transcriptional regulator n=1 Tax=Promicromonospora sp. NPDC050262 TaxID=3155036 RepID=UPI0034108778